MVILDFNTFFTFYIPGDSVVSKAVVEMPVVNPPVVCSWVIEDLVVDCCVLTACVVGGSVGQTMLQSFGPPSEHLCVF